MNKEGRFTFKGKYCAITYDRDLKSFGVAIYSDNEYIYIEKYVELFPVKRFSENYQLIAFHIANRHILTNLVD